MFNSLKKFKALPDHLQVWPAHGAGSACGKALGAVPSSTVGYEKLTNWALNIEDEELFVKELLDGQSEPPKYFAMMKKINNIGPKILGSIPHPGRFSLQQFEQAVKNNAANIQAGFLSDKISEVPYDKKIVVHCAEGDRSAIAASLLQQKGFQNVYNLTCGINGWKQAGLKLVTSTGKEVLA